MKKDGFVSIPFDAFGDVDAESEERRAEAAEAFGIPKSQI